MGSRTSRQTAPVLMRSPCPDSLKGAGCHAVEPVFQVSRLSWDREVPLLGSAQFVIDVPRCVSVTIAIGSNFTQRL